MNDVDVFFNTRIKHTGIVASIGNFFLAPVRFFFSGTTVKIEYDPKMGLPKKDGSVAKVRSFFPYETAEFEPRYNIASKQDPSLKATGWGYGADIIVTPLIQFVLLAPFTMIGSAIKGISYLDANVRHAHDTVKHRLTPQNKIIGSKNNPIPDEKTLLNELTNYLKTGQETKTLIIYAKKKQLTKTCMQAIADIRPARLALVGDWAIRGLHPTNNVIYFRQNQNETDKWNFNAFSQQHQPASSFDYSVQPTKPMIVESIQQALRAPKPGFFQPKHEIYVVKTDKEEPVVAITHSATSQSGPT